MVIKAQTSKSEIATVYVAEHGTGKYIEFVESLQPPLPIEMKWVLIVSTLFGCPVACSFCDCSYYYNGKLTKNEILEQIDFMVSKKFPERHIPIEKFKIQFSRMGEPAFNNNVLDVLVELPEIYDAPGFIPSLSTIAPASADGFFEDLLLLKKQFYKNRFQLQFSIHTTDTIQRDIIIPVKKWSFEQIADYGEKFYDNGGKKITLNFALATDFEINPNVIQNYFNPDTFLIKITPLNPTYKSKENNLISLVQAEKSEYEIINKLKSFGYETILSIGEWEENRIGSNCGQFLLNHIEQNEKSKEFYTYELEQFTI